mmetsp:Transcript_4737/g.10064  ORF Transcript_4737/g.10064 Transcript_4737/m.10064 type:complete len:448 (+) Transcript_4737:98-1441(+)
MYQQPRRIWTPVFLLVASLTATGVIGGPLASILNPVRRTLNLSSIFGSPTAAPSYERVAGQPVFAVTTSWGSPYLIFERTKAEEGEGGGVDDAKNNDEANFNEVYQPKQDARQVVLYFLDPDDAAAHRDEMQQIEAMKGADMRVMSMSLGKAIRQSTNIGLGLPTGQPVDPLTGKLKSPEEGGTLRYKIVPPKRELYYAARCRGRERVGLFDESADFDAKMMLNTRKTLGQYADARKNARMEREKARKGSKSAAAAAAQAAGPNAPVRVQYAHMEGTVGVPVFYCPGLDRRHPIMKRLVNRKAKRSEKPLFFSYEDLEESWRNTRERASDNAKTGMPVAPPEVEVYNLMDVITSIDRDQWRVARRGQLRREQLMDSALSKLSFVPLVGKLLGAEQTKVNAASSNQSSGLEQVIFIPSTRNVKAKERTSDLGGGKARLRPMRPWGKDM